MSVFGKAANINVLEMPQALLRLEGMMIKLTIAYGWVSSEEQAENQHAAEQQIARLINAGVVRSHIFFDVESGQSDSRPKFGQLIKLIETGEVGQIIATRWDRLSRNFAIYHQLKDLLQIKQVKVILLDQGEVDFDSASGELSADLQALLAVNEVRMLSERVRRGHAHRRNRRASFGRAPWGYRVVNEKYVLNTEPTVCLLEQQPDNPSSYLDLPDDSPELLPGISKADIARESIELFLKLKRPRAVIKALSEKYGVRRKSYIAKEPQKHPGIEALLADSASKQGEDVEGNIDDVRSYPQPRAIKRVDLTTTEELLFWRQASSFNEWIRNPILIGGVAYHKYDRRTKRALPRDQWLIYHDVHPHQRLMSDAEFADVQAILASNHRHVGTPQKTYYLTKLVICDDCGHHMVLKRSPEYRYYGCRHGNTDCGNRKCIRTEHLDEAIISTVFERAQSAGQTNSAIINDPEQSPEVQSLRSQIADIEELIAKHPDAPHFKQSLQHLDEQLQTVLRDFGQLNFVKATAEEIIHHPKSRQLAFWFALDQDAREVLYDKLVEHIRVKDGSVIAVRLRV